MYEKEINTVTKQWQQKSTVQLNKTAQDFFAPKKNILPSAENNNLIIGNIKENMQMKIANVVRRFNFGEWGGTETAVWNACKVLRANGNSPSIVSTVATGGKAEENVEGIPIRRFPYFYPHLFLGRSQKEALDKKGGNPFSAQMRDYLMSQSFDIIHSHAMGRIAKEAIAVAAKKGVPSALSFHGGHYDVPQSEFEEMAKPLKGTIGYGRFIEKILRLDFDIAERADGIICVGKNELEEVKKRFPQKNAVCIPNGVDANKFARKTKEDFREKFGIAKDKELLLCVSRIDYQKNQLALVGLVKGLLARGRDVHCAMVGFVTSKPYREKIGRAIAAENLSERFTIVEGLPPDSDMLISAYQTSDLFVLPSVHEPFGIVALEAWSAGLPLIASNVGGLKTLVENGVSGFSFSPNSQSEAVSAAVSAFENSAEITANAKRIVAENYSWESVARKLSEFYAFLVSEKNKR